MAGSGIFTVNNFAQFARVTRDALLHYEKIGLLEPVSRGENSYRYYSGSQLAITNVIRTLQGLGMTLTEIKDVADHRTPELIEELFQRQINKIDEKIEEWVRARKLLYTLQTSIHSALEAEIGEITVQFKPAEAIILGGLNDYSRGRTDYDALVTFYHDISKKYKDLDLNYSVWGYFAEERIKRGDWVWPDRFYFYNPEGLDRRPAALYAIGYTRGGYGQSDELYRRMTAYIDDNGFEICGDAFEEYPLNEICIAEDDQYLIRVMIAVREKRQQ